MATSQELSVPDKKELTGSEKTVPGRYFIPSTDVYETNDGLTLVMEMPGVHKDNIDVSLENDILRVEGTIDYARYRELEPVYTEYNIGHFTRSFSLSDQVDRDGIAAKLDDGVLTLTLPKSPAARPRRISIS
jgi:HSP20 family protein